MVTSTQIFEGIAAIAQLGTGVAVALGVWVAFRQLHTWRDEAFIKRRADAAAHLLSTAITVSDELRNLRSPFDHVPADKVRSMSYEYQQRWSRFIEKQDLFGQLRLAEVHVEAVIDDPRIGEAVQTIFKVRHEALIALDMLANGHASGDDQESRTLRHDLRRAIYGIYTEKHDPLGMEQLAAVTTLKQLLRPYIAMRHQA